MGKGGIDGFLGTRASLMLDIVVVAMLVVLPVMAWSIYLVRYRRSYVLHKRVQLALAAVLLVTVALFELDMRINGWDSRARESPYFGGGSQTPWALHALRIHLVFAVSTALLWIGVVAQALRKFPDPPLPGPHSRSHKFWGRLAALDMVCTAITGWIFYWLAFVS